MNLRNKVLAKATLRTWHRVSPKSPCEICGKSDWCTRSADGATHCMRSQTAVNRYRIVKVFDDGSAVYRSRKKTALQKCGGTRQKPGSRTQSRSWPTLSALINFLAPRMGGTLSGAWGYTDAKGAEVFVVFRVDQPDGSKQYRPIRRMATGWELGDPEGQLPLYNLPSLIHADTVYVVEGEKCADALGALGLIATTSAHGASSASKSDWSPLAGKTVIILPDNDEAGRRYAADVDTVLRQLTPHTTVATIALPRLADKGDVADWLAAGGTMAELQRIVAQPVDTGHDTRFHLVDAAQLKNLPKPIFHIDRLFPVGALVIVYGAPGSGQSFLVLDWTLSIHAGVSWLGRAVRQGPVVYIAAEGKAALGARVRAWERGHAHHVADGALFLLEAPQFQSADDQEELVRVLECLPEPPSLVVIDTLARTLVGGDENSAQDVGLFISGANRLQQAFNCTVVVVHHTEKKGKTERGSSALRGAADVMAKVVKEHEGVGGFRISCEKAKDSPEFPCISVALQLVEIDDAGGTSCFLAPDSRTKPLRTSEAKALIALRGFGEGGASNTTWRAAAELPDTTFDRVVKVLVDKGEVKKDDGLYRVNTRGPDPANAAIEQPPPQPATYPQPPAAP